MFLKLTIGQNVTWKCISTIIFLLVFPMEAQETIGNTQEDCMLFMYVYSKLVSSLLKLKIQNKIN